MLFDKTSMPYTHNKLTIEYIYRFEQLNALIENTKYDKRFQLIYTIVPLSTAYFNALVLDISRIGVESPGSSIKNCVIIATRWALCGLIPETC